MKKTIRNLLVLLSTIALGVLLFVLMQKNQIPVEHDQNALPPKIVSVTTVEKKPFAASVKAYGNVEPSILLRSKAEVSGKVSYLHPQLQNGGSISKGAVVVKIDPEDYEVTLRQTEADLSASQSQLDQLSQEEKNLKESLALAEQNLRLGQNELKRTQEIWEKRLIARSVLDAEEQKVIQLKQTVTDLEGQLKTFESRRRSASAQLERSQQQVRGQKTTLGKTEISLPFDARISNVAVEEGEFVSLGSVLFEATSIDGVEIAVSLPLNQLRHLFSGMTGRQIDIKPANLPAAMDQLGLTAVVRLVDEISDKAVWKGYVSRIGEAVDPVKRTLDIVVAIDNPYEGVVIGEKPPLLKGMFVEVELSSPPTEAFVVPRQAVHENRLYLADTNNQLELRPVSVQSFQGAFAIIQSGIAPGDRVIVNDLIPVIPGMPLQPYDETEKTASEKQGASN